MASIIYFDPDESWEEICAGIRGFGKVQRAMTNPQRFQRGKLNGKSYEAPQANFLTHQEPPPQEKRQKRADI